MSTTERRFLQATHVRSDSTGGKMVLSGVAARFNVLSEDLGGWRERLQRGCFAASLSSGADVRMLADHDSSKMLGRTQNRTLSVWETNDGLAFKCELPQTSVGTDVYQLCKRGDLNEMSFGFQCESQDWGAEADPEDSSLSVSVRTVQRAKLLEVSCVAWPAYSNGATSVGVDAAARTLFPSGLVPVEIRSRIAAPQISTEETIFRAQCRRRALAIIHETRRSPIRQAIA